MKDIANKKYAKIAPAAIGTALLSCFAVLGVACGGNSEKPEEKPEDQNQNPTAILTFIEGIDGNTTSFTYTANVGATLGSVLESVNPTAIDALKFGGWFVDFQPVDESATVTADGLTLTAKYLAGYTVSEYTQSGSGAYGEAKVTTGEAWYGEPFTYEYKVPEHYALGEKPAGDGYADVKYSTQSLAKNDTFTVYYALDQVTATYHLNPPEQSGVSDELIADTVYYGNTATAKAVSDFANSLSEDYRFAGWATSPDGETVYDAGEAVTFDSNADFYAKWDIAKADVNGGSDKLFVSSKKGESGVIILCREGVAEKRGTVNAAGGFTFTENEKVVLDGRIDGDTFYYYKDTLPKQYVAFDGTAAKMELKAHGEAVYTPAEGEAIIGSYELNAEDGTFNFVGGADKGFIFTLTNKAGNTVFRTVTKEAGYYALKTDDGYDYDVIYFDGLGRVTYFLTEEDGEVTDVHGVYDCTDENTKTYAISLYSETGANVLEVAVRLEEKSGTLGDYTLCGVYQVGDDYAGRYSVDGSSLPDIYVLDGFGGGTKNGKPGTYTVEQTESWTVLQNSVLYEVAEFWVRFTDEDGVSVDLDFDEDLYGTSVTTIAEGSLYGKYDFESAVFVNGVYYNDAFFIIKNVGTFGGKYAYLWIGTETKDGTVIYVQADEGNVYGYGNEYTFRNIDYQTFTFTVSESTVSCTDIGITIFDDETGALAIDSNGVAHFTPADGDKQEVEYFIEEGITYVYTFRFKNGDRKFVLQSDGYGETEATEILPQNVYEIGYLTEDRQNNYTARLIRLTDTTAILGLMIENDDTYYYCYYGTWGENKDGDYGFIAMNSAFPENGYVDVYAEYGHFLFCTQTVDGVNYFYQYDEAIEIECEAGKLVTDGYSIAEYTPANGEKITGTYFYDGNLVSIKTQAGDEYVLRIIDPEHFEISATAVGDEKGYYYSINDLGDGSEYYFLLDGKGTAILYNGSSARWGTYEKTGYVVMNVYEEYCLTFKGVDEEEKPTELKYHLILVPSGMISDDALYVQRDETQFGEYDIYENGAKVGELSGDGYFEGLYILGEELIAKGMLVRCDVEEDDYTQAIDYYPSTSGDFILFLATDDDGDVTGEYLFELNKDGKAILRTLEYGTYGHYVNGEESGDYIYLDGHGVATVYDKNGEKTDEGKYREFPELGEGVYQYASDNDETTFVFTLSSINGKNYYSHYTEKKVYTGAGWSALILDGFGEAVYIDRYGVRTVGDEINVGLGVMALRPYANVETMYFELNDDGTFYLVSDGWVVRNGVLYLYTGGRASSLRIPDGVTTILEGAFSSDMLDYLESIDLNGVTEIGANVFKGSGLTAISSENLLKIGEGAFKNSSVRTANIPSVTEIGAEAFYGCTSLTKVVLADIQKIGANAFTRSAYSSTVTEFDFTMVEDFTAINFNETAFENTAGELISIKVTVEDIAALNAVYETDWADEIKGTVRIQNKGTDDVSGNNYIDLMSGTIYSFTGGAIAKDVRKNNDYAEEDSTVLALYYINAEGKVIPYLSVSGVWAEAEEIDASENVMTIDGVTVWKGNTYSVKHEFIDSVSGKTLAFSISISRYASSYGLSVSISVPQYYFSFGEESGSDMDDLKYSISEHKFTFTASDGEYEITLTGANTCSSVKTKGMLSLEYVPESDTETKIRVTFSITNGALELTKFEKYEESYGTWDYTAKRIEGDPEETSENVFTVTIVDGNYDETYTVTYVPASDTNEASISVVLESKLASATLSATDLKWRATITYNDGKILDCTWFHNWDTFTDYEVTETTANDDGTLDVTVTDDKDATRTFKLKLTKNTYGNDALEVTETTGGGTVVEEAKTFPQKFSNDNQWKLAGKYAGEKLVECTYFAAMDGWDAVEYEIISQTANEDGTIDLTAKDDQNATRTFRITLLSIVESEFYGTQLTLEVAESKTFSNKNSNDNEWRLSGSYIGEKLINCTFFAHLDNYMPTEYEIISQVANADGTLDLTAKDDQNATRTFKIKILSVVENEFYGTVVTLEVLAPETFSNKNSNDNEWRISGTYIGEKLASCTFFAHLDNFMPTEYEIISQVTNADGTIDLTAKDDQDATRTFKITLLSVDVNEFFGTTTLTIGVTETTA